MVSSTTTPKELSVKQTIELMKDSHQKNYKFYSNMGVILSLLLVLDIVTIIGARIEVMNHIAWIGIYVLVVAIGFCFSVSRKDKEWYKYLSEWYDKKLESLKNKNGN